MMQEVLKDFNIGNGVITEPFGNGLINHTWKVTTPGKQYILQKVNHQVFAEPETIAQNIRLIADYLAKDHPGYLFVAPLKSKNGSEIICVKDQGFFRMFPFVPGSHSKDLVETPAQAYEAALQFGRFTRLLSGVNVNELKVTIPHFHNLDLRYKEFRTALGNGNTKRLHQSKALIEQLTGHAGIVNEYNRISCDPHFKLRVTHHDTKISNVLFNKEDKGICIIDLDTVMPGYFISDVGDMIRTYVCPVTEEEKDFDKIIIREEFYQAVVEGYYTEMKEELTQEEQDDFFYAGKFMIYMQALRFLTDYLNNDAYYGAKYESHNFTRAGNQAMLLQRFIEKEAMLKYIELNTSKI